MIHKYIYLLILLPCTIVAQKNIMIGAWVPYWRLETGVEAAVQHHDTLDQISPFSLEVNDKGNLVNTLSRKKELWKKVYDCYKKPDSKKLFVPTIYWTDTDQMHDILSNPTKRNEHIRQIIDFVISHKCDGININYERVCGADREFYLIFLEKLSKEIHSKKLVLYTSIGGRTGDNTIGRLYGSAKNEDPDTNHKKKSHKCKKQSHISLNPGKGADAVKYKQTLVRCCDQIHIMGYDEWGRPYAYSKECLKNQYYISHASNQWIEQIIQYALSFVPREKLVLGIPTYGLEFAVFKTKGHLSFKKRRNVQFYKAHELARAHNKKPTRTDGGELSFTYHTPHHEERYVCFLDSQSVKDKINLAKKYGIKGIYFFTINGNEDDKLWPTVRNECNT